jgi:hypothetical protein
MNEHYRAQVDEAVGNIVANLFMRLGRDMLTDADFNDLRAETIALADRWGTDEAQVLAHVAVIMIGTRFQSVYTPQFSVLTSPAWSTDRILNDLGIDEKQDVVRWVDMQKALAIAILCIEVVATLAEKDLLEAEEPYLNGCRTIRRKWENWGHPNPPPTRQRPERRRS